MSRHGKNFDLCQAFYDNATPPDEYCPVCGREWSTECICEEDIEAGYDGILGEG